MQLARWGGGWGAMLATAALAAATTALGAQGDALLVTGSNVNVRAGPSTDAGILARVGIDEPATEMRRLGDWVEVALPAQDVLGWIHVSLLAPVPAPAAGPAPEAVPAPAAGAAPEAMPEPISADARPLTVAAVDRADAAAAAPPATEAAVPATPAVTTAAVSSATPPDAVSAPTTALGQFRSDVEHFNNRAVAAAGIDLFTGVEPLGEGGVQVVTTEAWAIMSQPGQQSYLNALFGRWQAATGSTQGLRLEIVDSTGALMMERSGP